MPSVDTHYAYDGDRLLSFGSEQCVYDILGNPTVYRGKVATWERGRNLASYNGVTFAYNGQGRRTSKTHGDTEITFTYDGNGNLLKQSNGLEFLYDHEGVLGVRYDDATYFYRRNAQGDIIALLDSNGAVVVKYVYDAWGNHSVLDANGNDLVSESHIGNLNPYRYRGYYYDTETGLYYLQTRYYDPEVGRFTTIDDLQYLDPEHINGLNLYAYCGNNPVMNIDPRGQFFITLSVLLIAMGIGAVAGLIAGGVYGGLTAAASGQNIWKGILIGAVAGAFMGAGAGVAGLFIVPVLAGSSVVVAGTTLSAGLTLGIGVGVALASGFIGGMGSDLLLQYVNEQSINVGAAALTGLQWAMLNVANVFTVGLGGILDDVVNFALSLFFNFFYGAIGLLIDVMKGNNSKQNKLQVMMLNKSYAN